MWVNHLYFSSGAGNGNNPGLVDDDDDNDTNNSYITELFYSELVGDTYKIYLSLPNNYNQTSDRYPVLYILDADWLFYGSLFLLEDGGVENIVQGLIQNNSIPELILVGIGYPDDNHRNRDFMYPASSFPPGSGGAHEFYAFLENELVPFVDGNLRTNTSERTIIGDSYGGNFLLFSIFEYSTNSSSLFTNYITISPSVSYYDYYLLDIEENFFNQSFGILPINLHLSVGEDEWKDMVDGVIILNKTIISRDYDNLNFHYHSYPDEGHTSVVGPAITDGLEWAFSLSSLRIEFLLSNFFR